jgi:hypothetical protein
MIILTAELRLSNTQLDDGTNLVRIDDNIDSRADCEKQVAQLDDDNGPEWFVHQGAEHQHLVQNIIKIVSLKFCFNYVFTSL